MKTGWQKNGESYSPFVPAPPQKNLKKGKREKEVGRREKTRRKEGGGEWIQEEDCFNNTHTVLAEKSVFSFQPSGGCWQPDSRRQRERDYYYYF